MTRYRNPRPNLTTNNPLSGFTKINSVCQSLGMEIENAYEAFWFLHDHPQFWRLTRNEISSVEAHSWSKIKHPDWTLIQDEGGNYWQEVQLKVHAINENLDIFYTMVDDAKKVNDDPSKNIYPECWLEFGQVSWGYDADFQIKDKERCHLMHYHDYELDAGGPTFDEALIELANNALKKYGPVTSPRDEDNMK